MAERDGRRDQLEGWSGAARRGGFQQTWAPVFAYAHPPRLGVRRPLLLLGACLSFCLSDKRLDRVGWGWADLSALGDR